MYLYFFEAGLYSTDNIMYALITNYVLTSNGNIEFKVIATAFFDYI